jgi:lysophospholipid acyltransferase (LPLAT)-like uncharacterized protein
MKSLLRTPRVQAMLVGLVSWYLSIAFRTTRWSLEGEEHFRPFAAGAPGVMAFWHEFLPMIPSLARLARHMPFYHPTPVHALVSQHRDGRLIGEVAVRFGVTPIHGSSSRGGAAGLRNLLGLLRQGHLIMITPDGPRGPRRQAAPGVAQLAATGGVPVLPLAARTSRRIQFNSWDRMAVPLPFGRGVIVFGPAIDVPRDAWQDSLPAIQAALTRTAERAEALCDP